MEILGGGDGAWVPRLGGLEEGIGERSERSRPIHGQHGWPAKKGILHSFERIERGLANQMLIHRAVCSFESRRLSSLHTPYSVSSKKG